MSKEFTCRICSAHAMHKTLHPKEMMIGMRDEFEYFICKDCNTMQIAEVPADLPKYYGEGYYSYRENPSSVFDKPFVSLAAKVIFGQALKGREVLKYNFVPEKLLGFWTKIMAVGEGGASKNSKILDVGCGSGSVLLLLQILGFKNLQGIDPFIEKDIDLGKDLAIKKQDMIAHAGRDYDLIMFHHSFEHLTNPREVMQAVSNALAPTGTCVVRVPTNSSTIHEKYGIDSIEIDAPRHIFLHSKESMELMAAESGLKIDKIVYDSTPLQFWGSELYKKGVTLHEWRQSKKPLTEYFSKAQLKQWRADSIQLNKERNGSRFAVYLSKK